MSQPEKCPKCNTADGIHRTSEVWNLFSWDPEEKPSEKWACGNCGHFFDSNELVSWYDNCDLSKMKLSQIADIIMSDWSDEITPYARPYVEAMMDLSDISDSYGSNDAEGIVSYFLSNARQWKGPTARKVKAYLKKLVDDYQKSQE